MALTRMELRQDPPCEECKRLRKVVKAAREACRTQDSDDFFQLVGAIAELDGTDPAAAIRKAARG